MTNANWDVICFIAPNLLYDYCGIHKKQWTTLNHVNVFPQFETMFMQTLQLQQVVTPSLEIGYQTNPLSSHSRRHYDIDSSWLIYQIEEASTEIVMTITGRYF